MNVFLSYVHEDRDAVRRLRNALLSKGFAVWWDQDILPGQDWQYEIRQAMQAAGAVVLCLSGALQSRATSGVYPEIADAIAALRKRRPGEVFLIPVRLSPCAVPPLEIDATRTLDRLQYIDLFPATNWTSGLDRLFRALEIADIPPHAPAGNSRVTQLLASRARTWVGNNLAGQPYYPIPYHEQIITSLLQEVDGRTSGTVILYGIGGFGKAALTAEFARRAIAAGRFETVICEYSMHYVLGVRDVVMVTDTKWSISALLDAIVTHLGVQELADVSPQDKRRTLTELFHARPYLLLLQNLHLKPTESLDDMLVLLADLTGGNSCAVITSRRTAMPIYGRYSSIEVKPLDFVNSVALVKADAAARGVRQLQDASESALRAIYDATHGIPLAIRMVVGQARFLDVHIIVNRLKEQQGIHHLYELLLRQSWEQLSVLAKELLSRLALDESTKTWDQVMQLSSVQDEDTLIQALDQLSAYSLIDVVDVDQIPTYRVDAMTRNFLRTTLHALWDKQLNS